MYGLILISLTCSGFLTKCFPHWNKICKTRCAAGTKPPTGGFDVEMMGFLGAGNNPMVGMTVDLAVAVEVGGSVEEVLSWCEYLWPEET